MSKTVLYHGSNEKIEKPLFGKGRLITIMGRAFIVLNI